MFQILQTSHHWAWKKCFVLHAKFVFLKKKSLENYLYFDNIQFAIIYKNSSPYIKTILANLRINSRKLGSVSYPNLLCSLLDIELASPIVVAFHTVSIQKFIRFLCILHLKNCIYFPCKRHTYLHCLFISIIKISCSGLHIIRKYACLLKI